ncbi:MAG: type II secretion system F family protein [Candidatus Nanoarchaeia archaeon]|nr:type II secretion system F family protein [Candidatus Nanoarchaeia archaeon]MDD5741300.1 type II secretion system F family protein [Candidatus Nanoarchaeia archaeon]
MSTDALRQNMLRMKEIIREMYVFTNQLNLIKNLEATSKIVINLREKKLLNDAIDSLMVQLKILNKSIPELIGDVMFYKKLTVSEGIPEVHKTEAKKELVQIKYRPSINKEKVEITISEKDRREFLENLSKSNLTINQLKNKFSVERPIASFGKPSFYAKTSNKFFRNTSNKLLMKGYLEPLNKDLRRMNSPFVVGTYASMILFTMMLAAIFSILLMVFLLFYKISLGGITPIDEPLLLRFFNIFWVVLAIPIGTGMFMYFYPKSEGRNISAKIDQELPFVAIHMSAIATSGIEPTTIFEIIIKSEEYKNTRLEFRKLLNLINFQGYDLVTALKRVAGSSPSSKLRELLDGLATTITSGGDLHEFLDKHAEGLLFDYRLERERYTKTAETLMDIYISISIAAPMILLMLFIIMGSTGMFFLGLTTEIMAVLIILCLVILNVGFLLFLRLKQPIF